MIDGNFVVVENREKTRLKCTILLQYLWAQNKWVKKVCNNVKNLPVNNLPTQ